MTFQLLSTIINNLRYKCALFFFSWKVEADSTEPASPAFADVMERTYKILLEIARSAASEIGQGVMEGLESQTKTGKSS